jgi:hypothetical protein
MGSLGNRLQLEIPPTYFPNVCQVIELKKKPLVCSTKGFQNFRRSALRADHRGLLSA